MNNRVAFAFSRAAGVYERHALLQQQIGAQLLAKVPDMPDKAKVLDIGTGPGIFTRDIAERFFQAHVVGFDIAEGMVRRAGEDNGRLDFLQADAQAIPFKDNIFDCAMSNLVYQWVPDLETAFREVHRVLKVDGYFCFSAFGRESLQELFTSLRQSGQGQGDVHFIKTFLPHKDDCAAALQKARFKTGHLQGETRYIYFSDMFSILRWLKNIGAAGVRQDIFIGRDLLHRANDYYLRHFRSNGQVYATFEVIWGYGRKLRP